MADHHCNKYDSVKLKKKKRKVYFSFWSTCLLQCSIRAITFLFSNFNMRKLEHMKVWTQKRKVVKTKMWKHEDKNMLTKTWRQKHDDKNQKYDDEDAKIQWWKLDNYQLESFVCFCIFVFVLPCFFTCWDYCKKCVGLYRTP